MNPNPSISKRANNTLLSLLFALLLSLATLSGCASEAAQNTDTDTSQAPETAQQAAPSIEDRAGSADSSRNASSAGLDLSNLPTYAGTPYAIVSNNQPALTIEDANGAAESYSPLDSLGRCGVAMAVVSKDTMPTEKRGSIGMVKPSGWHTVRYDDLVDGKYLYNRCHLIGYQLTGENANERNLITGTRYLNTEGMLPFENQIADYVDATGNRVVYRVTPIFVGSELEARGVQMEALSVEDDGAGVSFNVYCFNVQPGVTINYANGESARSATENNASAASTENTIASQTQASYVLNTNSMKFHKTDCSSVAKISQNNKQDFTGTRNEVLQKGYDPCGICKP